MPPGSAGWCIPRLCLSLSYGEAMERNTVSDQVQATYIRMPRELHEQVKARAAAEERTMAQTIRHAVRLYLRADPA